MKKITDEVTTMLFNKKIPRSCAYCTYATRLNEDEALCVKKGIVRVDKGCLKFRYDPCKRIPFKMKTSDFHKYDNDDFTL